MEVNPKTKPNANERKKKKNSEKENENLPLIDDQIPAPFSLNELNESDEVQEEASTSENSDKISKSSKEVEILEEGNNDIKNASITNNVQIGESSTTMQSDSVSSKETNLDKFHSEKSKSTEISADSINIRPSSSIYPSISPTCAQLIPQISVEEALPIIEYPQTRKESTSMYPAISEVSAPNRIKLAQFSGESELLTESQLLEYYKNEQLDFVDDFVDVFVEQELEPRNSLYNLLLNLKSVCEKLQENEDSKKNAVNALTVLNNEVWMIEEKKITRQGKCGCERSAFGEGIYKTANLKADKLVQLREELCKLNEFELDRGLCLEIRLRSLTLQIQWVIVELTNNFLMEHQLSPTSLPILLSSAHSLSSRIVLRKALSDLFYFLRFPMLPSRFRESLNTWILELGAILLKACTTDDQMFLLAQILRCSSPIGTWAMGLIQTFISTPNLDLAKPMNSFVALISMFLQPIKFREHFLCRVFKYYEGENEWNFVNDEGDTESNNMLCQLSEGDLIGIFNQFSIRALFSVSLKYFTFIHQGNRLQVLYSLISFVLIVLKIFDEGLQTYISYVNLSKKISDNIKNLMQYLATYWELTKRDFKESDQILLQNEINRIVLQAIYYIVSKKVDSLWQFLVDFPYSSVTKFCLLRCQILLRNASKTSVRELYEISDKNLIDNIKTGKSLLAQLCDSIRSKEDSTYKVLALASIVANCDFEQNHFVLEIINVCFLEETTREHYYKAGSEAVSVILDTSPHLLPSLLKYIDRNVDHLDPYAVDILTKASLTKCQLNEEDVGGLLGKWLINRPLAHPASLIARRVLCSMNWGYSSLGGNLWLSQNVHNICSDIVVKSHIVHGKVHNNMISKSVAKATKLAMKCPNLEQNFDKFCWDILVKLKISHQPSASTPTNDLTAFYLFIQQKCLLSPTIFLENGLKYFVEILNSSSFNPALKILAELVQNFPDKTHLLIANASFRDCLERLIHADESSYAIQLLIGADKFPGPVLRLISSVIAYQVYHSKNKNTKKQLVLGWLFLLTCQKSLEWNADKFVLYLIGTLAKLAFYEDGDEMFGMEEMIQNLYRAQFQAWKDGYKGPLAWFSTQTHPPIIASNLLNVSPWASFLLLKVEPKIFLGFYETLEASMGKHLQRNVDEALKKANSKIHMNFTIDRLHFYRWLELATNLEDPTNYEVYPLILQQLCMVLFARKEFQRQKFCPGFRYLKCQLSEGMFKKLKDEVLPKAERATANLKLTSYFKAVSQWIFKEEIYEPYFSNFNAIVLDYLLQMAMGGESPSWIEFVELQKIRQLIDDESNVYSNCCHLSAFLDSSLNRFNANSPLVSTKTVDSLTKFFGLLDSPGNSISQVPFPKLIIHPNLPIPEKFDLGICFPNSLQSSSIVNRFGIFLDEINKTAKIFVSRKEAVENLNNKYLELFQKLYTETQKTIAVTIKCGNFMTSKCVRPAVLDSTVTASTYDHAVANTMNENRRGREEEISRLLMLIDATAIQSANLEYISNCFLNYAIEHHGQLKSDYLKSTGLALFYRICNSVVPNVQLLFPAGVDCYQACLEKLGKAFVAENPAEQLNIMRVVLSGNPLNHFLVQNFTPHCIQPVLLFQLYSELSNSVRNASTSEAALSLLSRLDIEHAGNQMPANQFSSLMPMIFENLVCVSSSSPLKQLCMDHFVHSMFHYYPLNFSAGLRLILSGCDSQSVPSNLFAMVLNRVDSLNFVLTESWSIKTVTQRSFNFTPDQILECIRLIAEKLTNSRTMLKMELYKVWREYLDPIGKLTDYLCRLFVYKKFRCDNSVSIIENELREAFYLAISVWGGLLEPLDSEYFPWTPNDEPLVRQVVDRLINLLNWLPHCVYLPPGAESVEFLLWQYSSTKLLFSSGMVSRSSAAAPYKIYEDAFVRLNWSRFWPTLLDLSSMEKVVWEMNCLEGSSLILELVVRFPWRQLLQNQENQPEDAHRAFYSLILSILSRCIYINYQLMKSRASFESLLKMLLDMGKWHYVKVETVEKITNFFISTFPDTTLTDPNQVLKVFLCIWRETCFFSTIPKFTTVHTSDEEINVKRAFYLRAVLIRMVKSTSKMDNNAQIKFYREILTKTNQFLISPDKPSREKLLFGVNVSLFKNMPILDKSQYVGMIKELLSFWTLISKEKFLHEISKTLTDWLTENCESAMVLLVLNTAMETLSSMDIQQNLRLMDSCVQIYFKRTLSCEWDEISQWINIPERSKELLYSTPRSDSGIQPYYFVLNAYLMKEMSLLGSAKEELQLIKRLADYIQSIKPKYVTSEPAFILCVEKWQRMLIRQYANGVLPVIANEELENYLKWLRKVHSEEKGVSFFSMVTKFGRKPSSYPIKLQLFAIIMDLYITQQQTSNNLRPRLEPNLPVYNARIQAFKDLQQQKQFQEFTSNGSGGPSSLIAILFPYFTQTDSHNLNHSQELLITLAQNLYPGERIVRKIKKY